MSETFKADESPKIGIARILSVANSPPGEIQEPVAQEYLDSGQAQSGHLGVRSQKSEAHSAPTVNVGIRVKVLRRLASAMFGLGRIFYKLGQPCLSSSTLG